MAPKSQYMSLYGFHLLAVEPNPIMMLSILLLLMPCILLVISMDDKASTKKTKIVYFYFLKFICVYVEFFPVEAG